jgi:hypothetical protein
VVSGAFADCLGEALPSIGTHDLRDVPEPQAVFTLS